MKARIVHSVTARHRWDRLKVSFWFAPALLAVGAVLLAWAMYALDGRIPNEALQASRFVLSGTVGELRSSLLNIGTTVLATAGVVFTLLTLPLSTVAAQYGSRLLRLFLGDRITQSVLGMFVGTFVYCMAGALVIAPVEVQPDGPQLTATVGLYLMLATFASLILLVQHISTMLQAPNIAAAAGAELVAVVSMVLPDEGVSNDGRADGPLAPPERRLASTALAESEGFAVRAGRAGYIQYIDPHIVLNLARDEDLDIRLLRRPGQFVWRGVPVALVWPAGRVDEPLEDRIRHAFQIGNARTPTQDIDYAVKQLVEMAVRAMSPAINDPYTAMTCLDYIGEGLALFIQQGEPSTRNHPVYRRLSFVFEPVDFDELLGTAFDMLRHASCDNASVLLHMLAVIDVIGQAAKAPEACQQLLRHVSLIEAESDAGALIEADRQAIRRNGAALRIRLAGAP